MSKVVKGIGRAIGKVVKGVGKVVSGVVKGVGSVVKKIASSKLGKILLMAATVYFGGAAIMGAMQGAAAGSGFLGTISSAVSGAGTGIANAWSALGAATSSAMGGNFAQAGSQLATGFQGGSLAGGTGVSVGATTGLTAGSTAGGAAGGAAQGGSMYSLAGGAPAAGAGLTAPAGSTALAGGGSVLGAGGAAQGGGLLSSLSPLGQYAAVSSGMQLAGGAIQDYSQQKQIEDERKRQEQNMSANFAFGEAGDSPMAGMYPQQGGQPQVPYPMTPGNQQFANYRPMPQQGLISNQMQTMQRFPTYNPALARYGYA
jgi:hypothetical protein